MDERKVPKRDRNVEVFKVRKQYRNEIQKHKRCRQVKRDPPSVQNPHGAVVLPSTNFTTHTPYDMTFHHHPYYYYYDLRKDIGGVGPNGPKK